MERDISGEIETLSCELTRFYKRHKEWRESFKAEFGRYPDPLPLGLEDDSIC